MRNGLRGLIIAAGLALSSLGGMSQATAPAATTAPAAQTAPADNATVATPQATNPSLAMDGAPAMTAKPMIGQPTDGHFGIQPQVTRNGEFAEWMHNSVLFPLITAISVFVLILLGIIVVKFRAGANPTPTKTSHNTALEVAWTLIPVVILVLVAVPSIGLLSAQFKPAPANAVTLKAIGNQWYWSYQYPDNGGFEITSNMLKEKDQVGKGERFRTAADGPRLLATDNRVVLPVGIPIRLITTSQDVIHSWAIPAFWIKLDAVPGRLNETSFTIDKPGLYFGQCSELCGARHGFMPITVEAVPPAEFAAWVRAKGGTMSGGVKSNAAPAAAPAESPAANAAAPANAAEPANAAAPAGNAAAAAPAAAPDAISNTGAAGNAGQ